MDGSANLPSIGLPWRTPEGAREALCVPVPGLPANSRIQTQGEGAERWILLPPGGGQLRAQLQFSALALFPVIGLVWLGQLSDWTQAWPILLLGSVFAIIGLTAGTSCKSFRSVGGKLMIDTQLLGLNISGHAFDKAKIVAIAIKPSRGELRIESAEASFILHAAALSDADLEWLQRALTDMARS